MNIFKINYSKERKSCLLMANFEKDFNIIEINDNSFFIKENQIVGFNIFNSNILKKIKNEGRVLVNNKLIKFLIDEFKLDFEFPSYSNYFYVGEIKENKKIDGTHLSLCKVNVGKDNDLQIVCGAKNVRNGLKVVVATVGILMNNQMLIKPTKLQGYDSYGMLCSQKELGLSDFNNEGIIELGDQYQVGAIFKDCYIYEFK